MIDHLLRIVAWLYAGIVLLFWDNNSVMCWVLIEGFAIAAGLFVGIPVMYLYVLWRFYAKHLSTKRSEKQ